MRIILMGTGPFAVPTCERLMADGHDIPIVVTRPIANPKAKKQPPRPVFEWAKSVGLPVFEPASINEPAAIEELESFDADLFFVCDYGQILSADCLSASRLGGINLHGSLLPRHRGAAPVQWAVLRGDRRTGVSVIHMTPRLDAGPTLAIAETEIGVDETAEQLEPRLARLGVDACVDSIRTLESLSDQVASVGTIGDQQDRERVTRAPRFAKAHGQLDFRLPADYLARLVRACQPWPGTFAELSFQGGKQIRLIVRAARAWPKVIPELANRPPGSVHALEATHLEVEQGPYPSWPAPFEHLLAVRCADSTLLVGSLQPAGKRLMQVDEFIRGHRPDEHTRFVLTDEPIGALCD